MLYERLRTCAQRRIFQFEVFRLRESWRTGVGGCCPWSDSRDWNLATAFRKKLGRYFLSQPGPRYTGEGRPCCGERARSLAEVEVGRRANTRSGSSGGPRRKSIQPSRSADEKHPRGSR